MKQPHNSAASALAASSSSTSSTHKPSGMGQVFSRPTCGSLCPFRLLYWRLPSPLPHSGEIGYVPAQDADPSLLCLLACFICINMHSHTLLPGANRKHKLQCPLLVHKAYPTTHSFAQKNVRWGNSELRVVKAKLSGSGLPH